MGSFWSCAIPRQHPDTERANVLSANEWEALYEQSEDILGLKSDVFDDSIRHLVMKTAVRSLLPDREVQSTPMAAEKNSQKPDLINWTGSDVVLGETINNLLKDPGQTRFCLKVIYEMMTQAKKQCVFDVNYFDN